jgi:hypothetical protein
MSKQLGIKDRTPGAILKINVDNLGKLQKFIEVIIEESPGLLEYLSEGSADTTWKWFVKAMKSTEIYQDERNPCAKQCEEAYKADKAAFNSAMTELRKAAAKAVVKRSKHKPPTPVSPAHPDSNSSLICVSPECKDSSILVRLRAEQDPEEIYDDALRQVCDAFKVDRTQCKFFQKFSTKQLEGPTLWHEATKQVGCGSIPLITLEIDPKPDPPEPATRAVNRKRRHSNSNDADPGRSNSSRRKVERGERAQHLGQPNHSPASDVSTCTLATVSSTLPPELPAPMRRSTDSANQPASHHTTLPSIRHTSGQWSSPASIPTTYERSNSPHVPFPAYASRAHTSEFPFLSSYLPSPAYHPLSSSTNPPFTP